jgi:hypothetical protein
MAISFTIYKHLVKIAKFGDLSVKFDSNYVYHRGCLGSCFVCMDIGSSERLCKISRFPIQLKLGLYQSGSFHPASQTKIGLATTNRPNATGCSHLCKNKKATAMKRGGF